MALERFESERAPVAPPQILAGKPSPEPLTPLEQAALDAHHAEQRRAAQVMERERRRAREAAWRAMTSIPLDELSARRSVVALLNEVALPVSTVAPRTTVANRFCALWDESEIVGAAHLGGVPDVSPGFVWPRRDGRSLAFLLQIDLAEVRSCFGPTALPDAGRLSFFYDAVETPWGFDPAHRGSGVVLHEPNADVLRAAAFPEDLPAEARFPAAAARFYRAPSLPSPSSEWALALELEDELYDRYGKLDARLDRLDTRHQLLGEADPIQSPMELECQLVSNGVRCGNTSGYPDARRRDLEAGARDWRLLCSSTPTTARTCGGVTAGGCSSGSGRPTSRRAASSVSGSSCSATERCRFPPRASAAAGSEGNQGTGG